MFQFSAELTCPTLGLPDSLLVNVIKAEYTYEDIITFSCANGRTMIGNSQIECLSDGTWSGSVPYCSPLVDSVKGKANVCTVSQALIQFNKV